MNPKLHHDAVADLPLAAARAELLEEIMSTPVHDRPAAVTQPPRHRRWLVPLAAAAAVAALLVVPTYLLSGEDDAREVPTPASAPPAATAHDWVVLQAEGWTATYVSDAGGEREVQYDNGDATLQVNLREAEARDTYIEDRRGIDHPKVDPGAPVRLLGREGLMWHYSRTDHTTIGEVEGEHYPEVRGSGMDEAAYVGLLDRLSWTDDAAFEASLPADFVTGGERESTISSMLGGVAMPRGFEVPPTDEKDPYQLGAHVAGSVACAWLDIFAEAKASGDEEAMQRAAAALGDSRGWDVLHEMNTEGDYPEVLWEYADEVGAGRVPQGYRQGLGCP